MCGGSFNSKNACCPAQGVKDILDGLRNGDPIWIQFAGLDIQNVDFVDYDCCTGVVSLTNFPAQGPTDSIVTFDACCICGVGENLDIALD